MGNGPSQDTHEKKVRATQAPFEYALRDWMDGSARQVSGRMSPHESCFPTG